MPKLRVDPPSHITNALVVKPTLILTAPPLEGAQQAFPRSLPPVFWAHTNGIQSTCQSRVYLIMKAFLPMSGELWQKCWYRLGHHPLIKRPRKEITKDRHSG